MLGEDYIVQYRIDRYVADFYLPYRNIILEADGTYWHSLPGITSKDEVRDARMRDLGYRVVRLSEPAIRADVAGAVVMAIGKSDEN